MQKPGDADAVAVDAVTCGESVAREFDVVQDGTAAAREGAHGAGDAEQARSTDVEQVGRESGVAVGGEAAGDATDAFVETEGFVDDDDGGGPGVGHLIRQSKKGVQLSAAGRGEVRLRSVTRGAPRRRGGASGGDRRGGWHQG